MIFFVVFACESERGGRRVSDTRTRPVQAAASATRLLVEDGLGLTAEAHLFVIVSALALREVRRLARLVLRDLVRRVLAALLALAVCPPLLRNVHHLRQGSRGRVSREAPARRAPNLLKPPPARMAHLGLAAPLVASPSGPLAGHNGQISPYPCSPLNTCCSARRAPARAPRRGACRRSLRRWRAPHLGLSSIWPSRCASGSRHFRRRDGRARTLTLPRRLLSHSPQVHDLDAAKDFYGGVLGCVEGRSSTKWQDYSLHGHQIVAHW